MEKKDSYSEILSDKERILIFTAHPDDMEINYGGTVARMTSDRKSVQSVVLTSGDRGVREHMANHEADVASERIASQSNAGSVLGLDADNVVNLNINDGEVDSSLELVEKLVFQIRMFKPDLVITHNPFDIMTCFNKDVCWVNHRDHRETAVSVIDAMYPYSREGFFHDQFEKGLKPHFVTELLVSEYYEGDRKVLFDVTDFIDKKKEALIAHTQNEVIKESEVDVYIGETLSDGRHYETYGYFKIDRLATVN